MNFSESWATKRENNSESSIIRTSRDQAKCLDNRGSSDNQGCLLMCIYIQELRQSVRIIEIRIIKVSPCTHACKKMHCLLVRFEVTTADGHQERLHGFHHLVRFVSGRKYRLSRLKRKQTNSGVCSLTGTCIINDQHGKRTAAFADSAGSWISGILASVLLFDSSACWVAVQSWAAST